MTSLLSIIISLIVLLIIIFIKDTQAQKSKNNYHGPLYYRLTNTNRFLIIISILIFIIVTIIDYNTHTYDRSWLSFITVVLNGLSIATLALPLSISNIYNTIFIDEEKLLNTKYIVTDIYDKKMIYKFNKAGINVIVLTKEEIDTKIKTISEKSYKKSLINGNLIIKTDNHKLIKNLDNSYYEFKNLKSCYKKIEIARTKADTIARILKYNILTYLPLVLLYFLLVITRFPVIYNILTVLLMKLITILATEYLYKYIPSDTDLMVREPITNGKIIGFQEIGFIVFTCFCILFCYSLPYQFVVSEGGTINLAISLLLTTFLFSNIFITYTLYSERALIANIIKTIKNIRIIVYVIIMIILSILLNFVTYLGTKNIGIQNYFVCLVLGLLPLLVLEIIKLARYTTSKGDKKNVTKNNKRNKRS
ncbi:MAG: cation transporting ATPase C-terminal domain-containing protein [Bacilli bacterium]|nr:cation transporting ATPase C-terminal domain-containing protein [Bacilli bacterium]